MNLKLSAVYVYNISRMSLKICIKFSFEYMEKRIREKFK
jgi:hypothetical protein